MAKKFIFEHKEEQLLSSGEFLRRIMGCALLAACLMAVVVVSGALAFYVFEGQGWVDALLNAVLIMTGLGFQGALTTDQGKIFTMVYSVVSAVTFYSSLGIFFSPIVHRFLHHFHLESAKD